LAPILFVNYRANSDLQLVLESDILFMHENEAISLCAKIKLGNPTETGTGSIIFQP